MNAHPVIGKLLIAAGALLLITGIMLVFRWKLPWLGQLPGDINVKSGKFSFYFPLATCVLLSILLTILLNLCARK